MADGVPMQFQDRAQKDHALRYGMVIFLISESLLFAGVFAYYTAAWSAYGSAFTAGVAHNIGWVGFVGTLVLLGSSGGMALATSLIEDDRGRLAGWCAQAAAVLGLGFLGLKGYEYYDHIVHGMLPGGRGDFFLEHPDPRLIPFVNGYWVTTGLHALHVVAGLVMILVAAYGCLRRGWDTRRAIVVDAVALYWHFVDALWIVIWPMYYGMGGGS
ncbi:MAG: cytochrome c oxidase subunit 3 [Planctomycetota bacterium]